MKRYIIIALLCATFTACKKESNGVLVRIRNASGTSFSDIQVGDASFGNLGSSLLTRYHLVTTPVYAAACKVFTGDSSFIAGTGVCGTPPPPAFAPGKYTFIILKSSSYPGYYDVAFVKD